MNSRIIYKKMVLMMVVMGFMFSLIACSSSDDDNPISTSPADYSMDTAATIVDIAAADDRFTTLVARLADYSPPPYLNER